MFLTICIVMVGLNMASHHITSGPLFLFSDFYIDVEKLGVGGGGAFGL